MSEDPKQWPGPPTERELLARLDERTDRLDRDVRQMMHGHRAAIESLEKQIDGLVEKVRDDLASINAVVGTLDKRSTKALEMAERHEKWFEWAVRLVLSAVILAIMGLVIVATP